MGKKYQLSGEKKEWKKVGFQSSPMISFDKAGQEAEGYYRGSRLIEKTGSQIHTLDTKEGRKDFWGSGLLDYLLRDIAPGTLIKIIFKGKQKIKISYENKKGKKVTGSREVRQYEVYTK